MRPQDHTPHRPPRPDHNDPEALRDARGVLDAFIDRIERGGEVNS